MYSNDKMTLTSVSRPLAILIFSFPVLTESDFPDLLGDLSLENHKNLKRLNLDAYLLAEVLGLVNTLKCTRLPDISVGFCGHLDFEEFADPDICAKLEGLFTQCDTGPPLVVRDESGNQRVGRLLEQRFPILHSKGRLLIDIPSD